MESIVSMETERIHKRRKDMEGRVDEKKHWALISKKELHLFCRDAVDLIKKDGGRNRSERNPNKEVRYLPEEQK
ncbi:hypothetical protein V2J09_002844 [Rumex salicifolius]